MNNKQKSATERLRKALDACHAAGLKGGVFDCNFCLWPIDAKPNPYDSGREFFNTIEDVGGKILFTYMNLDGGAGV